MCGIIGAYGKEANNFVKSNLHFLNHRGPDNQQYLHLNNYFSLGATRLAMVDPLARSNQPMKEETTGNVVVYNGEIYNFQAIKRELQEKGLNFSTQSDTEVLLKSLSFFGNEQISKFQGMFAFAFFNSSKNSITLARDYLGKKPLYYSISKDELIFSSKLSIVKKFIKKFSLNHTGVSTYLHLGYLINPTTMYNEIKCVEPGQIIEIFLPELKIVKSSKFVSDALLLGHGNSVHDEIVDAILERVSGHSNWALSLSGGVDSTIIASVASKLGLGCHAYSMRWPDSDKIKYNQDAILANSVAKKLGIKFKFVDMPEVSKIPTALSAFVKIMEEPNSNPSGLSMMTLYKAIADDGHRLVLTGDGSDEVFAGYERYDKIQSINSTFKIPNYLINSMRLSLDSKYKLISKLLMTFTNPDIMEFWFYWQQIVSKKYLRSFYGDFVDDEFKLLNDDFFRRISSKNKSLAINMYRDLRIWLSMESNTKLDRISMAYSIEARTPFQSEKVISRGFQELMRNSFPVLNKEILKDAFPEITNYNLNKTKTGFISPLGHWLRSNPEMIAESLAYLRKNMDFDFNELVRLSGSPSAGNYKDFTFLWSLIVLAYWHESEFH